MNRMTQNLTLTKTGLRGLDEFVRLTCEDTGRIRPHTLDENEEYYLSTTIGVKFWANRAQRDHARTLAERVLFHSLYRDVVEEMGRLRLAISNGDRDACYAACDAIESAISPTP